MLKQASSMKKGLVVLLAVLLLYLRTGVAVSACGYGGHGGRWGHGHR